MNEQAQIIYDALKDGDQDGIAEMRETVSESVDPEPIKEFEEDFNTAWVQYQADHEMPEEEREKLMAEAVRDENQEALEVIVEITEPEEEA